MPHDPAAAMERPAYPHNQWYVGALSSEVGHALFSRTLLGLPVVMFRGTAGRVHAAYGLCPHRGYPLGAGTLVAGGLRCGYHGLTFDAAGRCSAAGLPERGRQHALRTFAVVERPPLIWIWTGAPEAADHTAIPATADLGIGSADWCIESCGYLHVAARYGYLCDNLLDTAHITFIHNGTLERAPLRFNELRLERDPARVVHARESHGNDAAAFAFLLPELRGAVDVVITADFRAPGLIVAVSSEFYRPANDASPRASIARMTFAHALTPETATSTHYFPLFARNFRLTDTTLSHAMSSRNAVVAAEDKAVVETLETAATRFAPEREGFSLPDDELALRARRLISALVDAEWNVAAS